MAGFLPTAPGEPGIQMAAFNLREGRFRQSNLHLVKPARVVNRHYIEEMYRNRFQRELGSVVALAWRLLTSERGGLGLLYYYLLMHCAGVVDRRGYRAPRRRAAPLRSARARRGRLQRSAAHLVPLRRHRGRRRRHRHRQRARLRRREASLRGVEQAAGRPRGAALRRPGARARGRGRPRPMSPGEQALRCRQGAGLFRLGERGLVVVEGADRTRWLNGMLTNDVAPARRRPRALGLPCAAAHPDRPHRRGRPRAAARGGLLARDREERRRAAARDARQVHHRRRRAALGGQPGLGAPRARGARPRARSSRSRPARRRGSPRTPRPASRSRARPCWRARGA